MILITSFIFMYILIPINYFDYDICYHFIYHSMLLFLCLILIMIVYSGEVKIAGVVVAATILGFYMIPPFLRYVKDDVKLATCILAILYHCKQLYFVFYSMGFIINNEAR